MAIIWCGREDLKRVLAIFKGLQGSGQQATIIGHFTIQLSRDQEITNIDNVREQSETDLPETDSGKNPNRYTTEHGRNHVGVCCPAAAVMLLPDVVEVIAGWSNLPDSVKIGILAMVKAISK